jgi:hypothetical protein
MLIALSRTGLVITTLPFTRWEHCKVTFTRKNFHVSGSFFSQEVRRLTLFGSLFQLHNVNNLLSTPTPA